jgi:hypothetical protein
MFFYVIACRYMFMDSTRLSVLGVAALEAIYWVTMWNPCIHLGSASWNDIASCETTGMFGCWP